MVNLTFRDAIESLYDDVCNIYRINEDVDLATGIVKAVEFEEYLMDVACKVSYKNIGKRSEYSYLNEVNAEVNQVVKIFLAPELNIMPGCKFEVVKEGRTITYQNSGLPNYFKSHQEIVVHVYDKKA